MHIDYIRSMLKGRKSTIEGIYQSFGVLVPLIKIEGKVHLLFEVRAATLKSQPGEVSFPGGRLERGEGPVTAAVRETVEELVIPSNKIDVLGPLDYITTPFSYRIFPFVGLIKDIDYLDIKGNPHEVEQVFFVPLNYFLDNMPACHYVDVKMVPEEDFPFHLIPNGRDYDWKRGRYPVYFYPYGSYVIWGITARIIKNLVDILKPVRGTQYMKKDKGHNAID